MKNIDINKFNKAMDQLVESYADDKKVTEFERKVGASVCRAACFSFESFSAIKLFLVVLIKVYC